jgi:hypothetical protein
VYWLHPEGDAKQPEGPLLKWSGAGVLVEGDLGPLDAGFILGCSQTRRSEGGDLLRAKPSNESGMTRSCHLLDIPGMALTPSSLHSECYHGIDPGGPACGE